MVRSIKQESLARIGSDHFPIMLDTDLIKWGPAPFRFENMWLSHSGFLEEVAKWWNECKVEGWEGFKFMKKLEYIKPKVREWNKKVFVM